MYTSIGSIRLYYEQHGEGPDLVLLHGLGSSTLDWEYQIPFFAKYFRVTAIDARGHGQSDKPEGPYSLEMFAWDIKRFFEEHSMSNVNLLGLSMGGMISLHLALLEPERINSMVLANTAAHLGNINPIFAVRKGLRMQMMPYFSMERIGKVISKVLFPDPGQEQWARQLQERWVKNDRDCYLATMDAVSNHDVSDQLGKITADSLVITADNDLTLPIEFSWELYNNLPNVEYKVVPLSRHATPIDQSVTFNAMVLEYLARTVGVDVDPKDLEYPPTVRRLKEEASA